MKVIIKGFKDMTTIDSSNVMNELGADATNVDSDYVSSDIVNNIDEVIGPQFDNILSTLSAFRGQITQVQQQLRCLEKSVKKEIKGLRRDAQKIKKRGNRKRSGFAQPTKISPELCAFMEKAEGTEMARTEVTQYVIGYIQEKKLQNPLNRKTINPDDKLRALLGVNSDDEVTYFNLQRYMNKHFKLPMTNENKENF